MDSSFGSSSGAAGNASGLLSPSGASRTSAGGGGGGGAPGSLELLLGPMYSGKTTELLRRFRRASAAGKTCLLLKWAKDRRYGDSRHVVVTHDGQETAARPVERLAEAHNTIWSYDFICIDEGQFFGDLAEYADKWASSGATVVVAALDGDFQRQPFEKVVALVPLAESVTKMTAVCHSCHEAASFTRKLDAANNQARIDVGGKDKYVPVCRACYDRGAAQASSAAVSPVRQMSQMSLSQQGGGGGGSGRATPVVAGGKSRPRSNAHSPLSDLKCNVAVAAVALR